MRQKFLLFLPVLFVFFLEHATAQNNLDSLKQVVTSAKQDTVRLITIQHILGNLRPDSAEFEGYNRRSKEIAEKILKSAPDKASQKHAFYALGSYYSYKGILVENSDVMQAIRYVDQALEYLQKTGDKQAISGTEVSLGILYFKTGNQKKAIPYFFSALKHFELIKDENGVAYASQSIANAYTSQKQYKEAIPYYHRALSYYSNNETLSLQDKMQKVNLLQGLAACYIILADCEQSRQFLRQALRLGGSIGNRQLVSETYFSIGTVERMCNKDYGRAILNFKEAIKLSEDKLIQARGHIYIGSSHFELKQYDDAIAELQIGFKLATELKNTMFVKEAAGVLYRAYKKKKQYKDALFMHEQFSVAKDTMLVEEDKKMLFTQQLSYDYEKKQLRSQLEQQKKLAAVKLANQKESARKDMLMYIFISMAVILLILVVFLYKFFKQKNTISANKNNELKRKLLLTQMNPHFIFNSIDNIQSLIHSKQDKQAIIYLTKFSKLTRQILENSVENHISLTEEVNMTANYLVIQQLLYNNNFEYRIDVDEAIDAENTLVPPMLTQPFIENAVKHGLKNRKEGGLIIVRFFIENSALLFEVTDNGGGMETKTILNHKSMATQIVTERLKAAHHKDVPISIGNIIENEQVNGVRTRFEIPFISDN
ncbi:MAG TPA: histidine kinase [Flavobacterium sp.]|jgi:tetratricopeptide (TPR) repeat protein